MTELPAVAAVAAAFVFGALAAFVFTTRRLAAAEEKNSRIPGLENRLAQTLREQSESNARAAALEAQMIGERKAAAEKLALIEEAQSRFTDAFKALSSEALRNNNQSFLELARSTLEKFQEGAKGDLEKRQESIKGLVEPLKQQLEIYQKNLQQSSEAQSSTLGEVKNQLELLSRQSALLANETQQFRLVLHSNQARGRWGEETLRRVVEAAGMSAHCDFDLQVKEGDSKPDLVVKLPGERFIIVDAKVPDLDFLNALESADPATRAESLVAHAGKLKATIKALADRDYPRQFPNALDYVVLFVPAESLFSAALEGDHHLIVWAAERRILLATPASLIALLRSVSVSWQQHAQTENAQKIAGAAREFYIRVVKFTEHFEKIRAGLDHANSAFNDAAASFQARVRPAGERLAKLGGANSSKELPDVRTLDKGGNGKDREW